MNRERGLMLIGALVLIAPWSGLPLSWLEWLLPLLGLAVIALAFMMRGRAQTGTRGTSNASEMLPPTPSRPTVPEPRSSPIAFS